MDPFWISAFLDFAPHDHAAGEAFWSAVTGYSVSPRRGADDEFTSLVPPAGGVYLKVQRLGVGPSRIHLDLHVRHVADAAARAVALGGTKIVHQHDWIVMQSPAGITFCFVDHQVGDVPKPIKWLGGHRSRADQVCIDIPPEMFDLECQFWAKVTGRELGQSKWFAEFANLERPDGQPFGDFCLQRLQSGLAGAHFDVAATDRTAETERHVALGAQVVKVNDRWTVLSDPAGRPYCVIDRPPG